MLHSFYRVSTILLRRRKIIFSSAFITAVLFSWIQVQADPLRIVSIGGPVTEIVCALGEENALVGVDTSSLYPPLVIKLPQVGYARNLSAEGVLSLHPRLILAAADAGPPLIVEQLQQSGVSWKTIPVENSIEGSKIKIRAVAQALNRQSQGEALVQHLEEEIAKVQAKQASKGVKKKVLFLYARGAGTLLVAGRGTAADAMITLAGGINAVTGYTGYKPLTAEAIVTAMPDTILIPSRGLESIGGIEGLLTQPGIAQTPAGKSRRIVTMDDLLLLGFGPRLGEALLQLVSLL